MQHEIGQTIGVTAGVGARHERLPGGACAGAIGQCQDPQIIELNRAGKYSEALPLAQRTVADAEKARGPAHRDVAAALNNLGQV